MTTNDDQPESSAQKGRIQAEVISIGDELTSGTRLDTNSQWLSKQLVDVGIPVLRHTTVADDLESMKEVFASASKRSDVVVITGGLGPTADDLTREVLAETAGVDLKLDEASLQFIREMFASRGREMPDNNVSQAMFPEGSNIIPNGTGTAPGVDLTIESEHHRCRIFALPGVPSELKLMWRETIQQALLDQNPDVGCIKHHSIHSFGLGESDVQSRMPDLIRRGRVPTVGITASSATITLRISAQAGTESECDDLIAPTARQILDELGDFVFSENEVTLQEVVIAQLREQKRTFAVMDAGNCSLIADWLHEVDPQGEIYKGTISIASDCSEAEQLKFCEIERQQFQADLILLIGPSFEHSGIEKRDVSIISTTDRIRSRFNVSANPAIVVARSIKQALNFLRLSLKRSKI